MVSNIIYTMMYHPNAIQRQITRYIKFIELCQNQTHNCYSETHHILPVSIYPEYKNLQVYQWNSIKLNARQHFVAHCILARAFKHNTPQWYSMVKAFNCMASISANQTRYVNSRLYAQNRKHMADTMRVCQSNELNSQYGTAWVFNPYTDKYQKIQKELINEYYEQGFVITRSKMPYKKLKPNSNAVEQIKIPVQTPIKQEKILIKIAHPLIGIITVQENVLYDYILDGFVVCALKPNAKGSIRLTRNKSNIRLPKQSEEYFISNGWVRGVYTPNHRGTTGKKYSIVDGKRVYV